jgi:uncharacterized protein (DUF305 family)
MIRKAFAIGFVGFFVLASCGSSSEENFNAADVMFAQMMIPHHEQAIEMSDIALDPTVGASELIIDLATRIRAEQDPEIAQMNALLESWGKPLVPEDGMDHSSMMEGMLTIEELDGLAMMRGPEFDISWANAMIAHHEGAVTMARDVLESGKNPEVNSLATAIIESQLAEIEELKAIAGS